MDNLPPPRANEVNVVKKIAFHPPTGAPGRPYFRIIQPDKVNVKALGQFEFSLRARFAEEGLAAKVRTRIGCIFQFHRWQRCGPRATFATHNQEAKRWRAVAISCSRLSIDLRFASRRRAFSTMPKAARLLPDRDGTDFLPTMGVIHGNVDEVGGLVRIGLNPSASGRRWGWR